MGAIELVSKLVLFWVGAIELVSKLVLFWVLFLILFLSLRWFHSCPHVLLSGIFFGICPNSFRLLPFGFCLFQVFSSIPFLISSEFIWNASRRPPRPGRKQRGPTNCWCQFTAAHRRTERLKGWDERQKDKGEGARKNWTAEERDEAKKQLKWKAG